MLPDRSPLDLERLAPTVRGRPRLRVGVGAAVVLLLLALVVAVIVSAIGQQAGQRTVGAGSVSIPSGSTSTFLPLDEGATPAPGQADQSAIIFVHILGAVAKPGLFQLHDGARVMDAIAAAGGLTAEADPAGVNLARIVTDGEQFYVPRQGEIPPALPAVVGGTGGGTGGSGASAAKVNLNTATVADLDSLPRIGPTMAQRIIEYRTKNGRFTSVDGLRDVTGIGDKTFEALKDLITI
ncbi:helix-hairpin-helix domain-containing protein [Cryobacterium aureum]|uniref:helix-hairpin-helix domain-containing protein n=1 Tax=Cryobacterium aureum TaxID=995037 RepID=UPI000CF37345|nr:helix-hairpin-helix domain-containing protein [Cryobacterium aureum]